MNRIISICLLLLAFAAPAQAQRPWGWNQPDRFRPRSQLMPRESRPLSNRVPHIGGIWYGTGNPLIRCEIRQNWPDTRAEFINEHGSRAPGSIVGNQVWIPTWGEGSRGLTGTIDGDRIVWPDGNFWSRWTYDPPPSFRRPFDPTVAKERGRLLAPAYLN